MSSLNVLVCIHFIHPLFNLIILIFMSKLSCWQTGSFILDGSFLCKNEKFLCFMCMVSWLLCIDIASNVAIWLKFCSETTKSVLIASTYIHLKCNQFVKYTSNLPTVCPRILLSGPAGTPSTLCAKNIYFLFSFTWNYNLYGFTQVQKYTKKH